MVGYLISSLFYCNNLYKPLTYKSEINSINQGNIMIIKSIRVAKLRIPLVKPFITALRRIEHVEDVVIEIETNSGLIGYGSAAATHVITGDSQNSIIFAISEVITPRLIGKSIYEMHELQNIIHSSMVNNTSAKAAVDMALYDLVAKSLNLPLYKLLGGSGEDIQNSYNYLS